MMLFTMGVLMLREAMRDKRPAMGVLMLAIKREEFTAKIDSKEACDGCADACD